MRRLVVTIVIGAVCLAAPEAAGAASMWTLFDRQGELSPHSIAPGPHGTMWVSSGVLNTAARSPQYAVARVDLAGRFKLFRTTGETGGIAVAADGTAFATEYFARKVAIVSPKGKVTEVALPGGEDAAPGAIAAGADGNGWFVQPRLDQVTRVTRTGQLTAFPLAPVPEWDLPGYTADAGPREIAAGRDGRLWVGIDNGIATITTSGHVEEHSWSLSYPAEPADLAAAPDGTMWMSELEQDQLERIDASGNPAQVPGPQEAILASAPNGTLSAFPAGTAVRVRIPPSGATSTQVLRLHGDTIRADDAAPGPSGTIWLTADVTDAGGGSVTGVVVLNDGGHCIVPDLRYDDLESARRDLADHHCRPGRIARHNPRHFPASLLRVVKQGVRTGAVRRGNAKVAFTLSP
jgi:streptogramin lyase